MKDTHLARPRKARSGAAPGTPPAAPEAQGEAREILDRVAELPLPDRQAVILVLMLGLSCETAAAICGAPVATLQARLDRARRRLATAPREPRAG
jgi:RNA polymerase sigma-70 factor (ECF subfamily)